MSDHPILTTPDSPDDNMEKWEATVLDSARHFAYPPTPDIAAGVRTRSKPQRRRGVGRGLRLAIAALLALVIVTLAVPETRAFVLDVLRIGVVRIFFVEPTATPTFAPTVTLPPNLGAARESPTPTATPILSAMDLSGETTLADAERQLGSPILLPTYPATLGAPDHVFAQKFGGVVVTLVWLKSGDPHQVDMTIQILNDQIVASKLYTDEASAEELTRVNGAQAVWLTHVHQIYFFADSGQYSRQVDKNVLIWGEGTLTYRLETDVSEEEAVRIAESLR